MGYIVDVKYARPTRMILDGFPECRGRFAARRRAFREGLGRKREDSFGPVPGAQGAISIAGSHNKDRSGIRSS